MITKNKDKCTCYMKDMELEVGGILETAYNGTCDACGNQIKIKRIRLIYQGDVYDEMGVGFYHYFTPAYPFSCIKCSAIMIGIRFFCFPGKYEFVDPLPGMIKTVKMYGYE